MNYALDYIERWRHTRGYGVHSPLAYRIVKDCIRPDRKYGFYSDAYLDFEYHEDRKGLRNARMTIRLINLLRPGRIWYPNGDKRLCTALKMSFPKIQVFTHKECPKNIDFIISTGSNDLNEKWMKMDEKAECGLLMYERANEKDIPQSSTMTLFGRNFTLMLRRVGMKKISYKL